MPRYFFHIRKDEDLIKDDEGADFVDLEAAKAEAAISCRDFAAQEIREGLPVTFCEIEIWDDSGRLLGVYHVGDIVPGAGPVTSS